MDTFTPTVSSLNDSAVYEIGACNDIVTSLQSIPFSRRNEAEKKFILKQGRPIPKIDILQTKRGHCRSFKWSWYDRTQWLWAITKKAKLFCWPCLPLIPRKSVWSLGGYSDMKNLSGALPKHEAS